jgi:nucleoside-diphosphate-sugar epimerase
VTKRVASNVNRPFAGDAGLLNMRVVVIGATGYVGSGVARAFVKHGHSVHGLARSSANRDTLRLAGITPVDADISDASSLPGILEPYDIIVMAASVKFEHEAGIARSLVNACKDGDKHLLWTSGTGVLSIEAEDGSWNQNTFAEDDPFPFPARRIRTIRFPIENFIRESASSNLRTYVIRPPLIFGRNGSIQIPQIFESVRRTGSACYLGLGLNLYSAVHIDDLGEVYRLAVERGTPGALYHAVAGEANFRSIAEAVAKVCGCNAKSLSYRDACEVWGQIWVDLALAVNSRSIAKRSVEELQWAPRHLDVIGEIREGSYSEGYREAQKLGAKPYSWVGHD